jgi:hypothetical protein
MGRVRIVYNHIPAVMRALPREVDKAVDKTADQLANYMRPRLWRDTGVVMRTTAAKDRGPMSAEVGVGHNKGKGFYARFWEWGTARPNRYGIIIQPPKPVVGPAAHMHEPIYTRNVAEAIQRAARAKR